MIITHLTHYICSEMKSIFIYIVLLLGSVNFGFSQDWLPVKHPSTEVEVQFPKVPKLEKQQVFTKDGITNRSTYSTEYNNIIMVFQAETLVNSNKKTIKNAIDRIIEQTTVQLKGNDPKILKKKKDGLTYYYIEIPLITGELARSTVFTFDKYLYQIYAKGIITDVFSQDGNTFLNSWMLPNAIGEESFETTTDNFSEEKGTEAQTTTSNEWLKYDLTNRLAVELPGNPFKKTTVLDNGSDDIVIDSYAFNEPKQSLNYVVTIRPYSIDQGQLTNASIYGYYLDQIIKNKHYKLISEEPVERPHEGVEYVFSKGIQFYRLKLIRVNNVMYQFLIKGKRKSIYNENSEYFFNNINITN